MATPASKEEPNDDLRRDDLQVIKELPWRVEGQWGVSIVAQGIGRLQPGGERRPDDVLVGMCLKADVAAYIVAEHNDLLLLRRSLELEEREKKTAKERS